MTTLLIIMRSNLRLIIGNFGVIGYSFEAVEVKFCPNEDTFLFNVGKTFAKIRSALAEFRYGGAKIRSAFAKIRYGGLNFSKVGADFSSKRPDFRSFFLDFVPNWGIFPPFFIDFHRFSRVSTFFGL